MKNFFLIIAVCATVAVASPDAELNKQIARCLSRAKMSISDFRTLCSLHRGDEDPDRGHFIGVLTCIYTEANIINKDSSTGKITVTAENAARLVFNHPQELVELVGACVEDFADTMSLNAVMRTLYNGMYAMNYDVAYEGCRGAIQNVVLKSGSSSCISCFG